ncbi:hypothetical protein PHYSODRAFT_340850 [Phytophthora sojae]|uniref:hydroxymethylbilane synthase n=1 Tax=Phytophthora sojae (strain P6497) TaxID=1094619 RepID=G5ACV8_PHYSP|nr:hypothetical protein PHYSODRAFT_340850 [Phytophthora sojae]EGZ06620.1 hypothetical protein PHYSODRAFT_340850 [Phytophthora sojae]|eukprot:XP_009537384.1 hypothetical protein PHYSODRAFT_340850 [Phytophthora sojae]
MPKLGHAADTETLKRTIYVPSRKNQLATAQINTVIAMLEDKSPALRFVVGQQDTVGDQDMPTTLPEGLLATITKRETPEDAAVIHPKHKTKGLTTLKQLPEGSVIGTGSLRREALLRKQFPTFEIKTLRGNIQTRQAKLDEHDDYDAIIVAACCFRLSELGDRIDEILPMDTFGYGVGQGSIGVESRADDGER